MFQKTVRAAVLFLALLVAAAAAVDSTFVNEVKALARGGQAPEAQQLVERQRPQVTTPTPEWLAALSWVARGHSFEHRWESAQKYARETLRECEKLLASRSLGDDKDAPLPIALGAAIEVLSHARNAAGDRSGAVAFLQQKRRQYAGSVIETRIQKNLLLLSLEGKPMPELERSEYLGSPPPSIEKLRGKVVLFFFWAHWCSDCRAQKPVITRLYEQYSPKGFRVIGPTQLWGYTPELAEATPEQELAYLEGPYQQRYPLPEWMPAPLSGRNFTEFGVSTTPTLVLVDRQGTVRLYHPGRMSYGELAQRIEALL